jgi:hypothetical protein
VKQTNKKSPNERTNPSLIHLSIILKYLLIELLYGTHVSYGFRGRRQKAQNSKLLTFSTFGLVILGDSIVNILFS